MVDIVGNGQLASLFHQNERIEGSLIFASGVSNTKCVDENEFLKEKELLVTYVQVANDTDKIFVYFSSAALSAKGYPLNRYYQHKKEMEELIRSMTNKHLIIRIPQLFGKPKKHPTLINFLYFNIVEHVEFEVYDQGYRYLLYIEDTYFILQELFNKKFFNKTLTISNPYCYSILDIVAVLEEILGVTAKYKLVKRVDKYHLDFRDLNEIISLQYLEKEFGFGKDYLYNKMKLVI